MVIAKAFQGKDLIQHTCWSQVAFIAPQRRIGRGFNTYQGNEPGWVLQVS